MISLSSAVAAVRTGIEPLEAEEVPLLAALGRVSAAAVRSPLCVPPWDNSAMDGYAIGGIDAPGFRVVEVIAAGGVGRCTLGPGEAAAIMTGAPVPTGTVAVVPVEDTDGVLADAKAGDWVRVLAPVSEGQHVRPAGCDLALGAEVVPAGQRLGPGALGLLASAGFCTVSVRRRPVVAILSTGDELVEGGQPLGPGQIYSSNNVLVAALVVEAGGVPLDAGIAADSPAALTERLRWCVAHADVVVTTGGVSVGAFDHVREVMQAVGAAMGFWKIDVQPGKPVAFGYAEHAGRRVPIFGLPGNPVSAAVQLLQLVRPYVLALQGHNTPCLGLVEAIAAAPVKVKPGRLKLMRVSLRLEAGKLVFALAGSQSSGVLASLARGQGLLVLPGDSAGLDAGASGLVQVFDASALAAAEPGYPA